ncbi:MAG: ankyrin repeat domain-containing protein, partial [Thermoguttaceae bacterium]|nr:ankyrin repeat domain-containing protein [Thermoguttaceae bacterium]
MLSIEYEFDKIEIRRFEKALKNGNRAFFGKSDFERTILHYVVLKDDLKRVKELVEHGCDVNAKDHVGVTPLHFAARNGSLKMVKLLVELGADVSAKNQYD